MRSSVVGALFALAGTALSHGDETPEQAEAVTVVVADDAAQANIADAVSEEAVEAQEEDPLANYVCDTSNYEISIFSQSPLVIYITNFVTPFERQHLQRITNGTFARSNVAGAEGDVVSTHRTSSSTTVGVDPVTSCISERARRFQSFDLPPNHQEPIQLVRYAVGEQYHFHHDWFPAENTKENGHASVERGGNRVSSFFAYVSVSEDIAGGGTKFPKLAAPEGDGWCGVVECDQAREEGVTFRPIEGNAVFWTNLVKGADGEMVGDDRVLHAGLPIEKGSKLGMNLWTKIDNFA
ncbi:Prolyl 4-hydroxylase 1 like protein [Verticillium longisporum]|uniref:Oxidoreductase n=4 Tax=Verticillium TaxID=1036719 RepID=G2XHB7_VERDV|nr:oxidoreductase [Verticillium dahliae VdLs.17]KAF3344551.1 Putative beta-glucosidase G [Verticillium dahliae VDG2]KAG7117871.1 Prolyl 4-hydroxylase 1 like protein [Verticillium longisporum]KAH6688777.1 oxidoreductase [Verticillium dahliae]EGY19215.1 oxidoreductase [Verticillium dahliae VdLs.17]KAG7125482.1 Prolyl 4-hydroxylase 1 like protein [Verticillium longisporum]